MSPNSTSPITTHVIDVSVGRPATGVPVLLEVEEIGTGWKQIARGTTDRDGRVNDLLDSDKVVEGTYRLTFETRAYFADQSVRSFYPEVTIVFSVYDGVDRYHVPLLLSPFGYSTYRGCGS
jgi:5-hydroxyisourate hydrolase